MVETKYGRLQNRCISTHRSSSSTNPSRPDPLSIQAPLSPGLPLIREQLNYYNISRTATGIITASWRSGTSKQYQIYFKRWEKYCQCEELGKFETTVQRRFRIDIMRSTLPAQHSHLCWQPNNITFGSHPLVVS